jgi:ABC-type nitrate/sulfonate/bicarbonate transport system substrate-binding protein
LSLSILTVAIAITLIIFTISRPKKLNTGTTEIKILGTTAPAEWEIMNKFTGGNIFKEEGIKIKIIPGASSAGPRYQALLTGQLDVEGGAWVGWINVIARGGKIKAVTYGSVQTKDRKSGIMVLENSPISTVKDLVGKTIAVNSLGLTSDYIIKEALKKNNVPCDRVQLIAVPSENQEQVLRTNQVDGIAGAATSSIQIEMAFDRGGVRMIPGTGDYDICGENVPAGTGFREDFINEHPELVRGYVKAIEKSKRYVWNKFKENPEAVRKVYYEIAEEKGSNPKIAKFYIPEAPYFKCNTKKDIQWWIDLLVSEGKLKPGQVKVSDVYTDEFNFERNKGLNTPTVANK